MEMGGKILIVDDDPLVREVLQSIISSIDGLRPDLARDGSEGLEKARNNLYEIIFTDLKMPGLNGMDFLREVKKSSPDTSIVVITGFPTIETAVKAMKEGADDFLTKPFNFDSVTTLVNRITNVRGMLRSRDDSEESIRRLNSDLFSKVQKINLLKSISTELDYLYNNKELYEKIVEMASKLMLSREVSFGIVENGFLKIKKAEGVREQEIPIGGSIFEQVLNTRNFYLALPGEINPHTGGILESPFLSIPFAINNEVFGILNVSDKVDGTRYSEDEICLGLTFSKKVALRIENNALYEVFYNNLVSALKSLVNSIEARDSYTKQHSERVTAYALQIAETMGLDDNEKNAINFGGYLHDIGKIGVRDTVLLKPGRLTDDEMREIRLHPVIGHNIIEPLRFFPNEKELIRYHHERFDGSGYPDGIAGSKIPLLVRILSVADTYDAMTSTRPYRAAKSHQDAVNELLRCSNSQFDGEVVKAFLQTRAGMGGGLEL